MYFPIMFQVDNPVSSIFENKSVPAEVTDEDDDKDTESDELDEEQLKILATVRFFLQVPSLCCARF
jgi:hypothetical protein